MAENKEMQYPVFIVDEVGCFFILPPRNDVLILCLQSLEVLGQ